MLMMLMTLFMLLMWLILVMTKLDSSTRPTMVILVISDNESDCYHMRRLLIHFCSGTSPLSCWLAATMSPSSRLSLRLDHTTSQRSDLDLITTPLKDLINVINLINGILTLSSKSNLLIGMQRQIVWHVWVGLCFLTLWYTVVQCVTQCVTLCDFVLYCVT